MTVSFIHRKVHPKYRVTGNLLRKRFRRGYTQGSHHEGTVDHFQGLAPGTCGVAHLDASDAAGHAGSAVPNCQVRDQDNLR